MKDLKTYLEEYQVNLASGHREAANNILDELMQVIYIKLKTSKETEYEKPVFVHKEVEKLFTYTCFNKKYELQNLVDYDEFFSMFLIAFTKTVSKSDPFKYNNKQIISWFSTRCRSLIMKELKNNYDFSSVSDSIVKKDHDEEPNEILLTDMQSFSDYQQMKDDSAYKMFLKQKGGLHIILNKQDAEIIELCFNKDYLKIKQTEIAKQLNLDPKYINKRKTAAVKKLKKEYHAWKLIDALKASDIYHTVANYIKYYDKVSECENGEFDYFHFFSTFLIDNYKQGEQFVDSMDLFRNKKTTTITVFDILTDYLKDKKLWKLLHDFLEGKEVKLNESQKDKIVILGIKAFKDFISSSNKIINKVSSNVFE